MIPAQRTVAFVGAGNLYPTTCCGFYRKWRGKVKDYFNISLTLGGEPASSNVTRPG